MLWACLSTVLAFFKGKLCSTTSNEFGKFEDDIFILTTARQTGRRIDGTTDILRSSQQNILVRYRYIVWKMSEAPFLLSLLLCVIASFVLFVGGYIKLVHVCNVHKDLR